MSAVRFYVDEHVPKAVVGGLRRRGIEVIRVPDVGLLGHDDDDHLAFAREQGAVIYTQDADFLRFASASDDHAGVAYAPQGRSIGDVIRGLVLIAEILTAEDMVGQVEYL